MAIPETIRFYHPYNETGYLSNFYVARMSIDGIIYQTVEHYFQAQKNPETMNTVARAITAYQAYILGRRYPIRPDWEEVKENVMRRGLMEKFRQHPDLEERLMGTGNSIIIEMSTDEYWGNGRDGTGMNRLGVILMEVREVLRNHHVHGE